MLRRQDNQPTAIFHLPRSPTAPIPPQLSTSSKSPEIIPIRPQREHRLRDRERELEARPGRRPVQLVELKDHSSGEDESPPPTMLRRHQRESRSVSPIDRYEAEKIVTLEKERRRHEEKVVREEREALERATHLGRYERPEREREEAQRRIEFEEKRRIESVERARRRDQREEYERQQARDRARKNHDSERTRLYGPRRRQEEEDFKRLRIARLRSADESRRSRHDAAQRYGENREGRGERFIREAIEREHRTQAKNETIPLTKRSDSEQSEKMDPSRCVSVRWTG